jgi:spore coat polysaccharide biosynthesis predicted glycosyltransferase SpsG
MKSFLSLVSDPLRFGRGHLNRQLQLRLEFEELGIQHFVHINGSGLVSSEIEQANALILDLSALDKEPRADFLEQFNEVIGFDWSGQVIPDRNFVVVNHPDREYRASKYVSVGLHNLIIRSEIARIGSNHRHKGSDYLLISLGYSSKTNAYRHAMKIAKKYPAMPQVLACGVGIDISPTEELNIVVDSSGFVELLAEASAVISNGGTTYVESLLMGKAVLPIPQTKDEQFFVDAVNKLTVSDSELPDFRRLDLELAYQFGVGTQGAFNLCKVILGN